MRKHLRAQIANFLTLEPQVYDTERPPGEIHDRPGQGLVERCVGGPEARETHWGPERAGEGAAEGEAAVFGRVVVVDCTDGEPVC